MSINKIFFKFGSGFQCRLISEVKSPLIYLEIVKEFLFMKADGENHNQLVRNKNYSSLFLIVKVDKWCCDN
jgi:hypothetical protein